jgi:hypothetical protein
MNKRALMTAVGGVVQAATAPPAGFHYGEIGGPLQHNGLRFVVVPDATTSLVELAQR